MNDQNVHVFHLNENPASIIQSVSTKHYKEKNISTTLYYTMDSKNFE